MYIQWRILGFCSSDWWKITSLLLVDVLLHGIVSYSCTHRMFFSVRDLAVKMSYIKALVAVEWVVFVIPALYETAPRLDILGRDF